MENRSDQITQLSERLEKIAEYLHLDEKRSQVEKLTAESAAPGFWDDSDKAQKVMSHIADLKRDIDDYARAKADVEDLEVANELALDEDDEQMSEEVAAGLARLESEIDGLELASWFTDELDAGDAIITVTPGQGGLEAQDWTEMLFKMLTRYCDSKGWRTTVNDAPAGEVIGLDRATFTVSGHNAYGTLKSEQGVHRLVRISPTDDKKRRQTTFAGVEVLPVLPDDVEVEIDPGDVRVDVYHSGGPGGQGVNTTDSAVRLTHLPTGIVVTCQNERSQTQNKEVAFRILRAKLYEIERQKREEAIDELRGPKREISFGSQIRNYVLYPYQMVKDLRTGVETGNVDAVLDGDIDRFVVEFHRWRTMNAGTTQD